MTDLAKAAEWRTATFEETDEKVVRGHLTINFALDAKSAKMHITPDRSVKNTSDYQR